MKYVTNKMVRGIDCGSPTAVTGDYTGTSYTSIRAEQSDDWQRILSKRSTLIDPWASLMFRATVDEFVLRGIIQVPEGVDYFRDRALLLQCEWLGAGQPIIDEVKQATADNMELQSKTSTYRQILAKKGKDLEDHLDDLEEQKALFEIV
jgi:capsid protein